MSDRWFYVGYVVCFGAVFASIGYGLADAPRYAWLYLPVWSGCIALCEYSRQFVEQDVPADQFIYLVAWRRFRRGFRRFDEME